MAKTEAPSNSVLKEDVTGFCVSLSEGKTRSKHSNDFEDLLALAEGASIAWLDIKLDDFDKKVVETATRVGFSELLVKRLLARFADGTRFQGGYEDYDAEMGLLFPAVDVKASDIRVTPLLLLLKKSLILTIRSNETHIYHNFHRYAEAFLKRLPKKLKHVDWLTLTLLRIIDENNERNFEKLQELDRGTEDLTKDLKGDMIERSTVGDQIYKMKYTLVRYLACLWATSDTLNSLRYGDADLISEEAKVLDRIGVLAREVRDQLSLTEHLAEVLASSLECLQSIYNNQLQNKNNLLQDKNNLLQEKNNKLADLNNMLQEKNNKLQEYNNQLTLSNNRLTVLNNKITLLGGFLAILSAGFIVPNTIATVMSQTNIFALSPADMGWYLGLILASTVATTVTVWYWVRRKGLLPKTSEEAEDRPILDSERAP